MIFIALVALASQEDLAKLHDFPAGTKWVYTARDAGTGKVLRSESRVVKKDAAGVTTETRHFEGPKDLGSKTQVWTVKSGLLMLDTVAVFMSGARKGDGWTYAVADTKAKAVHQGVEELKVPAGTYKDAIHVRHSAGTGEIDVWLVPGIGIAKSETRDAGKPGLIMELKEFTPAK